MPVEAFSSTPHAVMTLVSQTHELWKIKPHMLNEEGVFYDKNDQVIDAGSSVVIGASVDEYPLGWSFI